MVQAPLQIAGQEWLVTCVSMGNPHAVVFGSREGSLQVRLHVKWPLTHFVSCWDIARYCVKQWLTQLVYIGLLLTIKHWGPVLCGSLRFLRKKMTLHVLHEASCGNAPSLGGLDADVHYSAALALSSCSITAHACKAYSVCVCLCCEVDGSAECYRCCSSLMQTEYALDSI